LIEGEEERRMLRIESMMVKKTSLEIGFEAGVRHYEKQPL